MNQGAAQGHLDCLYQNPKLTKIPCFQHSGMSRESIERQASLASQRNALSAHSERSLRSRQVDRCARITIRCSLRSHTQQQKTKTKAKTEKRKINSVLPSVAGHTHIHTYFGGWESGGHFCGNYGQTDGRTDKKRINPLRTSLFQSR